MQQRADTGKIFYNFHFTDHCKNSTKLDTQVTNKSSTQKFTD